MRGFVQGKIPQNFSEHRLSISVRSTNLRSFLKLLRYPFLEPTWAQSRNRKMHNDQHPNRNEGHVSKKEKLAPRRGKWSLGVLFKSKADPNNSPIQTQKWDQSLYCMDTGYANAKYRSPTYDGQFNDIPAALGPA